MRQEKNTTQLIDSLTDEQTMRLHMGEMSQDEIVKAKEVIKSVFAEGGWLFEFPDPLLLESMRLKYSPVGKSNTENERDFNTKLVHSMVYAHAPEGKISYHEHVEKKPSRFGRSLIEKAAVSYAYSQAFLMRNCHKLPVGQDGLIQIPLSLNAALSKSLGKDNLNAMLSEISGVGEYRPTREVVPYEAPQVSTPPRMKMQ